MKFCRISDARGDMLVKMMTSDFDLLQEYVGQNSEEAFATLVNRRLDLVYSAALRQTRSPQLAEEVAQSVFTDLSRDAHKLKPDTILTAWLYQVTRRTAVDVIRRQSRRQLREQIATEMNAMNSHADSGTGFQPVWADIEPLLDGAMESLDETDRAAVLLRYFENKSLREVGQQLGTSDDAAQKRVSRAVERLREFFAKRGVTVGASGLVVVLSANAVQGAPVGLAVTISTAAALAGTTIATTATVTAAKAIAMTTLQKTLTTATIAVAVGTGIYEARQASTLRSQVQTLQQQQGPLAGQIEQLTRERDDDARQVAALRDENGRLRRDTTELPRLRGELARLRAETRELAQLKVSDVQKETDPTESEMKSWLGRVKQLKQHFEQWPGKKTPELQLLREQDWLNEVANRELDTDSAFREAMGHLRWTAKGRFATAVNEALEQYAKSNHGQLPSDTSRLIPYLKPPLDSILENYEIAKPGWVHPPKPSSPNSERAETWAIIERGNFSPDGMPIRDGSNLADPDYDMYVVIYQGGYYGYGTGKPSK